LRKRNGCAEDKNLVSEENAFLGMEGNVARDNHVFKGISLEIFLPELSELQRSRLKGSPG
jgi:hypothetical protein